ncbi:MAG: SDR family oxidoreductase [Arthrobacter sp.]|uniref:SDR family oxidoreductase n=1 Tax=Arthrobacter sp. TaxID=1667 RepID=UPI003481675E
MYEVPPQAGRRFVVTGANSGTGRESALRLARAGASVVLGVRSPEKGESARASILREVPGADLEVRRIDLADLSSVAAFAAGLVADGRPVDTLVNNAGVMAPPRRMETADGFELQFGTNFLGPFALTNLLIPLLLESPSPRVATMSSAVSHIGKVRFGDLNWERGYRPMLAYAQSKLGNLLMALRLAEAAAAQGSPLMSTLAHPGYTRTNLQMAGASLGRDRPRRSLPVEWGGLRAQDVRTGAEPLLFAAADPGAAQGAYYGPSGPLGMAGPTRQTDLPRSARGATLAGSLWAVAEDLTGTRLPPLTPRAATGHPAPATAPATDAR